MPETTDVNLELVVRVRDLTRNALARIGTESAKVGSKARNAFKRFGDTLRGLPQIAKRAATAVRGAFVAAFAGIAAGYGLFRLGRSLTDAASDAEEIESKFRVVFQTVNREAESAAIAISERFRRSIVDVRETLASFQDTFVPFGFARQEALELSKTLTDLSFDLSSFYNREQQEVIRDLQSALVGQTETVRKYGVVILDTLVQQEALNLGLAATREEITEQDKVLARLSLVMKGTRDAQGDLVRTQDSFANRSRALLAVVKDLRVEFGQRLIRALDDALTSIGGVEAVQRVLRSGFAALTAILTSASRKLIEFIGYLDQLFSSLGGAEAIDLFSQRLARLVETFGALMVSVAREIGATIVRIFTGALTALRAVLKESAIDFRNLFAEILPDSLAPLTRGGLEADLVDIENRLRGLAPQFAAALDAQRVHGIQFVDKDAIFAQLDEVTQEVVTKLLSARKDIIRKLEELGGADSGKAIAALTGLARIDSDAGAVRAAFADLADLLERGVEREPGFQRVGVAIAASIMKNVTFALADEQAKQVAAQREVLAQIAAELSQGLGAEQAFGPPRPDRGQSLAERIEGARSAMAAFATPVVAAALQTGLLNAELELTRRYADDARRAAEELALTDVSFGIRLGISDTVASLAELNYFVGQQAVGGTFDVFRGFFRDVASGAKSASDAIKDFGRNFLGLVADIFAQLAARQIVTGLFGASGGGPLTSLFSALGFEKGGIMPGTRLGTLPVKAYAGGGIADSPQVAVYGEGSAGQFGEAFVPLGGNRRIPVEMRGGGGATTLNATFLVNSLDPRTAASVIEANMGVIGRGLTDVLQSGRDRAFLTAVRSA